MTPLSGHTNYKCIRWGMASSVSRLTNRYVKYCFCIFEHIFTCTFYAPNIVECSRLLLDPADMYPDNSQPDVVHIGCEEFFATPEVDDQPEPSQPDVDADDKPDVSISLLLLCLGTLPTIASDGAWNSVCPDS